MEDDKTKAKLFDDIYIISHLANGNCKNPHKEWQKKIIELQKDFS
jgi:hypothetical protein